MKRQLQRLGFSYPWSREIATCDPEYYRWNQWFFLRMLEKGIAYRAKAPVNWCPSCLTVLANEQAEGGLCWRCKSVGRAARHGAVVPPHHRLPGRSCSTTWRSCRPGPSACSSAAAQLGRQVARRRGGLPGRGLGAASASSRRASTRSAARPSWCWRPSTRWSTGCSRACPTRPSASSRSRACARQDRRARLEGKVEKEGVFTGRHATNPFTGEKIPVWVGNFVLMGYGTGAIMSVPAHDQRDFEFARKYGLAVRVVIQPEGETLDGATLDGGLRRAGQGREQRRVRRPRRRRRRSRSMAAWAAAEGHRQGRRSPTASRTG